MEKSIELNFRTDPDDPNSTCKLQVDWTNVEDKVIKNLCVLIVNDNTGDAAFSFLSLHYVGDEVSLPQIKINVSSKPFTVYVYGLERTLRRVPYFYQACASGTKKLTYTAGQSNCWKLDLDAHSVGPLSLTEHKDLDGQEPFSMTHRRIGDSIMLNTTEMEFPEDVLVVLKEHEESNEIFWLTAPESIIKTSNGIVEITPESISSIDLPFDVLSPGTTTVRVYTLEKVYCKTGLMIYHNKTSPVELNLDITAAETPKETTKKPDLTRQETEMLMSKALDFISSKSNSMSPIKYLYRNKSPYYYDSILEGHGIMETYRKDYNGHERSCINGVIDGLFFGTSVHYATGKPLHFSYFGKKRLLIPPKLIITNNTNMYFADFYCLYNNHYVTVVVTKPGSHADDFCKDSLPKLDAQDNRFIRKDDFLLFSITQSLIVEIFYTEDIDIASLMTKPGVKFTDDVELKGNGKSTKFGIPKNKDCKYCNL